MLGADREVRFECDAGSGLVVRWVVHLAGRCPACLEEDVDLLAGAHLEVWSCRARVVIDDERVVARARGGVRPSDLDHRNDDLDLGLLRFSRDGDHPEDDSNGEELDEWGSDQCEAEPHDPQVIHDLH